MPIYTGVGSRSTPHDILQLMANIAVYLAEQNWVLRSGAADGADRAFEKGCDYAKGIKEIYLPWKDFNASPSKLYPPTKEAFDLASTIHPAWPKLKMGAKKLHARNTYQVLGWYLDKPSDLLICWTEEGKDIGGTATALKLARQHGIRIINLATEQFNFEEWSGYESKD